MADFLVYWIVDCETRVEVPPHPRLVLQLRDKQASGRRLFEAALALRGYRVYVNDRADVARAAGCEGVHLPENGMAVRDARRLGLRVGVSLHSPDAECDADFCVLSPIFESPGKGAPLGLEALARAAGRLPVYALGGVTPANAQACLSAGAHGVAAIRAGAALARELLGR